MKILKKIAKWFGWIVAFLLGLLLIFQRAIPKNIKEKATKAREKKLNELKAMSDSAVVDSLDNADEVRRAGSSSPSSEIFRGRGAIEDMFHRGSVGRTKPDPLDGQRKDKNNGSGDSS